MRSALWIAKLSDIPKGLERRRVGMRSPEGSRGGDPRPSNPIDVDPSVEGGGAQLGEPVPDDQARDVVLLDHVEDIVDRG